MDGEDEAGSGRGIETGEPEYENGKNQKGQVKWISDGLKNLKLSGIRTERSIL